MVELYESFTTYLQGFLFGIYPYICMGVFVIGSLIRFDRDQYSAFDETGLAIELRGRGVRRLWIGGLAQDICVRATVLDARREGFEVILIADGTRPVTREGGERANEEMRQAGVCFETTSGMSP